ncbi:MAG TPA: nucleotidyltransferase family protein [Terracidiphilus sp.]|jgi:CTP:molybdopterin cytidylyltransferase MocA|nr:nucleotidyltransferase family protein [Terracidiphilus sp.]
MPIPALILAAGASRRLGRPKQLLMFGGETLLSRAIRLAQEAGAFPILVVLGANLDTVRDSIHGCDVVLVVNQKWDSGISGSIHAGLHALEESAPGSAGLLILSCDQPRLTSEHLRSLLQEFQARKQLPMVASTYAGIRGIPAVFPRVVFPHLQALEGDRGARKLLMDPPLPLAEVEFAGGEIDIDSSEDLSELG